jgi:hypothetical protein
MYSVLLEAPLHRGVCYLPPNTTQIQMPPRMAVTSFMWHNGMGSYCGYECQPREYSVASKTILVPNSFVPDEICVTKKKGN